MKQPFIITSPDLGPDGREFWIIDPEAGPRLGASFIAKAFFGWNPQYFSRRYSEIQEEVPVELDPNDLSRIRGRKYTLYQVERIMRVFLHRGIIDYRRFFAATQVLKGMGSNYKLL